MLLNPYRNSTPLVWFSSRPGRECGVVVSSLPCPPSTFRLLTDGPSSRVSPPITASNDLAGVTSYIIFAETTVVYADPLPPPPRKRQTVPFELPRYGYVVEVCASHPATRTVVVHPQAQQSQHKCRTSRQEAQKREHRQHRSTAQPRHTWDTSAAPFMI